MSTATKATWGALCWAAAAPVFLIANVVVGLAWAPPGFSWATNNISDLGNVTCGIWDTTRPRYVCSPWHTTMNIAFVLTALLLLAGLLLTWRTLGAGRALRAGRGMMLLWPVGLALAGLFPADTHENLHFLAAMLIFGPANAGLVVAGFAHRDTPMGRLRPITLAAGLLAVAGSVLFLAQQGLGIGLGAMERVAALPFLAWTLVIGVHTLISQPHHAPARPVLVSLRSSAVTYHRPGHVDGPTSGKNDRYESRGIPR